MTQNRINTSFTAFLLLCISFGACKDKQVNEKQVVQEKTKEIIESTNSDVATKKKSILFFGDSLTAGLGLEEEESFPALIQNRLDSLKYNYTAINAGLSGETSAGGKGRINWVLKQPVNVFILELGANDVLRGLQLSTTEENLRDILDVVKKTYPECALIIAGMEAPPNMGTEYTDQFRNIFNKLASDFNAGLIPFLLEDVAGNPALNLNDGKHPNALGQKIVMENVWGVLKTYL